MANKPITVFISDDHEVVRKGLRDILEHHHITVVGEAGTYADTIEHCFDNNPDVLIIDLNMDNDNGILIIEELIDKYPDARILVYSMRVSVSTIYTAYQKGAQGYVTKNSDMSSLIDAVNRIAEGKNYYMPDMVEEILGYSFENTGEVDPRTALTEIELDIFKRLAAGEPNKIIAEQLGITTKSVANRAFDIRQKLGIPITSFEWIARKNNLLPLEL